MEIIKIHFKEIRQILGKTQSAFAEMLSVGQSTIADIERGRILPSSRVLTTLRIELGVNLNWIFTGEGFPFSTPETRGVALSQATLPEGEVLSRLQTIEGQLTGIMNSLAQPRSDGNKAQYVKLPFLSSIAAGPPIDVDPGNQRIVEILPSRLGENLTDCYVLQVRGNSMIDGGIYDGDMILVKETKTAENGEIVVALVENSATLKKFYHDEKQDLTRLVPLNASYAPFNFRGAEQEQVFIQGTFIRKIPGGSYRFADD